MRRTAFLVFLLLVWPVWLVFAQQSGRSKFTVIQPGETVQETGHTLTNDSIIKLVKAKLSEDTIITIVNTQPGKYSLGADDIVALKRAGVSDKIISAIANKQASTPTPAAATAAPLAPVGGLEKRDPPNPPAAGPEILYGPIQNAHSVQLPELPGLFYTNSGETRAIIGQAVLFRRTGSRLADTLTFGIVSGKINIKIPGIHAGTHLGARPVFYYHTGPDDPPGVLSLVLSRLKESNGDRQLEAKASGAWRASEGISINSQIQTNTSLAAPSVYKVEPQEALTSGEYAFYLRTTGASTQDAFLYAFSVE
jgi:hypothetical protein